MKRINNNEAFKKALSSLSLVQQRQIGARFIVNVLDLTDESYNKHAQSIAEKSDATAEELENAYHAVHSVYVATRPYSGLSKLDFETMAAHFVAEANMACLAANHHDYSTHHLAEKVAMYCRMARTCANIQHEQEYPKFIDTEESVKKEIDTQYEILNEFLENC